MKKSEILGCYNGGYNNYCNKWRKNHNIGLSDIISNITMLFFIMII